MDDPDQAATNGPDREDAMLADLLTLMGDMLARMKQDLELMERTLNLHMTATESYETRKKAFSEALSILESR